MNKTKTILTLLAASCSTVLMPSMALAQPVIVDQSIDGTTQEIITEIITEEIFEEPVPIETVQPVLIQPVPIEIESTPLVASEEENSSEDHSGHDHGEHANGQHANQGPELTVDNVPFALTEAPDDHVLGDDKAPITMIVYASVTCSHCSEWFTNEWPAVKKDLIDGGKIRFVFRELPTAPAQMSMVGFMMAECAPSEDYFEVVQYQMENQLEMFKQAEIGKVREEYDKVGKIAGLEDEAAIQACFQDLERLSHIHTNGDRATAAKVQGVPAFYINGDSYKGGQSADELTTLITEMSEKGLSKLPTTLP